MTLVSGTSGIPTSAPARGSRGLRRAATALILGLFVGTAAPARAQGVEITPFAAYRFGNSLRNGSIDASVAYGAELGLPTGRDGYRLSIFSSYANPEATARLLGGTARFNLNVVFTGFGGSADLAPDLPVRPVVGGHLLWTHLSAAGASIDRFGLSGNIGLKASLGPGASLTGGWRAYSTLVDGGTSLYCGVGFGAGCSVGVGGYSKFSSEFYGGVTLGLGAR